MTSPALPASRASIWCGRSPRLRGVHPRRAHLDHPPHRSHGLDSLAADVGNESGRRAEFRALRRKIRSGHRRWRARNLDTGEGVGRLRMDRSAANAGARGRRVVHEPGFGSGLRLRVSWQCLLTNCAKQLSSVGLEFSDERQGDVGRRMPNSLYTLILFQSAHAEKSLGSRRDASRPNWPGIRIAA